MTHRWVDKDDFANAKSRFTARGFEQTLTGTEDFYSATPREAVLRLLLVMAELYGYSVVAGDAAQAFLQAPLPGDQEIYVKPPEEAHELPGRAWKLLKTLPGLKCGPVAWGDFVTQILAETYDLKSGTAEPCLYYNTDKQVWALRHMDDFFIIGPRKTLEEITDSMKTTILLCGVTWLDKAGSEVRFLGRVITRMAGGFDISVCPHLAEEIIGAAGTIGHRVCLVPGHRERRVDQTPLNGSDHAYFRSQVGRLLFYVQYRPDMQYVVGQLSRRLAAPCNCDMVTMKRCIRYLAATKHYVLQLRPEPLTAAGVNVEIHSDADWAGLDDRKSVSCGILYVNGACILSYSRTQATQSLSSCESELYAEGSASVEALWTSSVLREAFGAEVTPVLRGDSSSALSLAQRIGLGRLKHIELRFLAFQSWVTTGRLAVEKIGTEDNTSDIGTKFLTASRTLNLATRIGLKTT